MRGEIWAAEATCGLQHGLRGPSECGSVDGAINETYASDGP